MKYLNILEYPKMLERLAAHAISESGKAACLNLLPFESQEDAQKALNETDNAMVLCLKYGVSSFMDMTDIVMSANRAANGATLSIPELLAISNLLAVTRNQKNYLEEHTSEGDALYEYSFSLIPDRLFEEKINNAFPSPEEVWDGASPQLKEIRKKQNTAKNRIRSSLDSYIKSPTYQKYLQDAIITIRNDRYVIPVKAEFRAEINGLVHDTSASGATLFVEPMSVVTANNELSVLAAEERREIERILNEFSSQVGERSDSLILSYHTCTYLDFTFAKAKYAIDSKAFMPVLNAAGEVDIKSARHPLIDKGKVVPIDISFGKSYTSLIITGPNTGGKTVSLKTAGIICLMAKSGLFIPAKEGSKVAFFDRIFADIGDEQSIEQSLSTFSSHMTNIVSILSEITDQSLVLIDELGSGTDPAEGAALAIAIIEDIKETGARLICTTHYAELKMYAVQSPEAENASCEFDVSTLRPTYRLIIGLPGKSNAFAIASRLGISDRIIEKAKENLSNETVKVDSILADLEISRKQSEFDSKEAARMKAEARAVLDNQEQAASDIRREADEILNSAKQKAAAIIERSERETKKILAELEELRKEKERADFAQKIAEAKSELKAFTEQSEKELEIKKPEAKPLPRKLEKGDTVRILSINKEGIVLEAPDSKGYVLLQAGIVKTKVKLNEIELIEKPGVKTDIQKRPVPASSVQTERGSRGASLELDIRGMTAYEAETEVENFINNCWLAGLKNISIIHGKGTGALRSAVREQLKNHKLVSEFRLGVYGEGETGVTIVTLK